MRAEKENLPKSRVKFTITMEPNEFKVYFNRAFEKLAKETKIPGFRPGKAPRDFVEAQIGQDKILSDALDMALPESWREVILESKIIPLHQPEIKIKVFGPATSFIYEAEVDVLPQIDLPDYKKIKIKAVNPKKITEKDVDETIKNLQKAYAQYNDVKRPAKKGDRIEIDYEGFIRGAKIEQLSSKNHPMILGETKLIPGFEEKLIDLRVGERREFELILPKELPDKFLAGQKVKFKVKMLRVQERKLPKIDNAFAKRISKFKTLKQMREDIKKSLVKRAENQAKSQTEKNLVEKIVAKTNFELPESLVKQETLSMIDDFARDLERRGIKFKDYLEKIKKTREEIEKEIRKQAEKRVRISLIIAEIKQQEKVNVSESEIDKEVEIIKKSGQKIEDEVVLRRYIKSVLANQKTLDKLVDYCTRK